MNPSSRAAILNWLKTHPGIFSYHEEGEALRILEHFSRKNLTIPWSQVQQVEVKSNSSQPGQSYLVILLQDQRQLVLSLQGLVFPPDFRNTGPIPLPSQVYCMEDYVNLLGRLQHVAAEAPRKGEALQLVLILIAILDGARAIGLEVSQEEATVESILNELEKGNTLPDPHG